MSPDIIMDHIPTAREGLLVQSREGTGELGVFLSSEWVSEEALFVLSGKNPQDQTSVALINTHAEKESPQGPFCRMKIEVRAE